MNDVKQMTKKLFYKRFRPSVNLVIEFMSGFTGEGISIILSNSINIFQVVPVE